MTEPTKPLDLETLDAVIDSVRTELTCIVCGECIEEDECMMLMRSGLCFHEACRDENGSIFVREEFLPQLGYGETDVQVEEYDGEPVEIEAAED